MGDDMPDAAPVSRRRAKPGKYLTFKLSEEIYGLEILKVQEIIGMMAVTRVPRTPLFIRGVINLRGRVIPVLDMRAKFDLAAKPDTDRTCIIVVQLNSSKSQLKMGVIVDEVNEVCDIPEDHIESTPELGSGIDTEFIMGMGKLAKKVVMLLDIDRVLAVSEISVVEEVAKTTI